MGASAEMSPALFWAELTHSLSKEISTAFLLEVPAVAWQVKARPGRRGGDDV